MNKGILVVGAGPVGLAAAATLAMDGVPVTVLEKREGLSTASKASTWHPPTLEILDKLGVIEHVLPLAARVTRIQFREVGHGIKAEFDMGILSDVTQFPFRLHLEQSMVTPFLLEKILEHTQSKVLFGREVIRVQQNNEGVVVETDGPSGREVFEGAYLIAADGAHSAVRDLLNIDFTGTNYANKVLRVMTPCAMDKLITDIAPLTYIYRGEDSISLLQMPDCWRIILRIDAALPDEEVIKKEWFSPRIDEYFGDMSPQILEGAIADVFSVSKRLTGSNRIGRIVFAGDAVHLTNTRGGMNMNCGIHDAYALAKSLIATARDGNESHVSECATKRLDVATNELLPATDKRVATGSAWLNEVSGVSGDREKAHAFLRSASMLEMRSE